MDAFSLVAKLSLDSSSFNSDLNKSESTAKSFGNSLKSGFSTVAKAGAAAFTAASAAAVAFGASSVKTGMEFDKSMSQVAATMGKSVSEIGELRDFAREMGATTAFSAQEAADALNYMALAGYDSEKSMSMLPNVLNLAAAGGIALADASNMVTVSANALGLSTSKTETLVDQMAVAASKSGTSVQELGDAISTVGATAKNMKGGTTELTAVLGVLADNGLKGAEGGTKLRNILLTLSNQDKSTKALKQLGLSMDTIYDSEGNMRELPNILSDINTAMSGMTQEQKDSILNDWFGKADISAVNALLGTNVDRWDELYGALINASGAAGEMAETQLDNLAGDVTLFKSALSEAYITVSDVLTPSLRNLVQKGTQYVGELTDAFKEGGLKGAVTKAASIIKTNLINSLSKIKVNLAKYLGIGETDTITWASIATGLMRKLKEQLQTIKLKIADLLGIENAEDASWGTIAKDIADRIKGKFTDVKIKIADLLGIENAEDATWGTIAQNIVDRIKTGFANIKLKIADVLGIENDGDVAWSDIAKNISERIKTGFTNIKLKIADVLGLEADGEPAWSDIAQNISDRIKTGFTGIKLKIADLLGIENDGDVAWSTIATNISDRIKTGFTGIKLKIADLLGIESDGDPAWSTIGQNISDRLKTGLSSVKLKIADLLGIEDTEETTWADIGKDITGKIAEYIDNKGGFIKQLILGEDYNEKSTWSDVFHKISEWISEEFQEGGIIDALLGNAAERAAAVIEFAGDMIVQLTNWINGHMDEVTGLVTAIANSITRAAGPIITALCEVIKNPEFLNSFKELIASLIDLITSPEVLSTVGSLGETILSALFGEDLIKWVKQMLGIPESTTQNGGGTTSSGISPQKLRVDAEQQQTLAAVRRTAQQEPNALYLDENGKTISSMEAFENTFRQILSASNYTQEETDALWNKAKYASDEGFAEILEQLSNAQVEYEKQFSSSGEELSNSSSDTSSSVDVLGTSAANAADALNGITVPSWATDTEEGSHAKGSWSIPYDDYIAKLHRGEMVLTASQARRYRDGETGGSSIDAETMAATMVTAVQTGMASATVRSYLSGRDVTSDVNRNMLRVAKARRYAT